MAYEPIRLDGPRDLYRTPIWITLATTYGIVTVWVGKNIVRHFKPDQLPDEIKVKLAFVLAADPLGSRPLMADTHIHDSSWAFYTSYVPPELPHLVDMGWRISKSCVCLVVSGDLIFRLRGE